MPMTCHSNDWSKSIAMLCAFDWGMELNDFSPFHFTATANGKAIKFGVFSVSADGKEIDLSDDNIWKSDAEFIIFVIVNKSGDNCVLVKNDESLKESIEDNKIDAFKLKDLIKRKFAVEIGEYTDTDLLYDRRDTVQESCSVSASGDLDCVKV